MIKNLLWSPLTPPNSLQHFPHQNFTIHLPFWSQDFKLQRWSSSDIPISFFFNFSTATKYIPIISCGIIIDLRSDSMTKLPFALIINDVGGICSMDRSKSQPNSCFLIIARPFDPKIPTFCHFAPFDGTSTVGMTKTSNPILLNFSNFVLIMQFASTTQNWKGYSTIFASFNKDGNLA